MQARISTLVVVGLAVTALAGGCSASSSGDSTSAAGPVLADDPAVAQVEALSALAHPVSLTAPSSTGCPSSAQVAAALASVGAAAGGATATAGPSGDPVSGCTYSLGGEQTASLTYVPSPVADVRATYPEPSGPYQSVSTDLDGIAPGAWAVLAGSEADEDDDVLLVPTADGSGTWTLRTVGVSDGVAGVLVALADAAAARA